jgi:hypothetical protein
VSIEQDRIDAQRWRQLVAAGMPENSRLYRVRLLNGRRELLADGNWSVVLDLTPGVAVGVAAVKLDEMLRSLLGVASVPTAQMSWCYLDLRDWVTGEHVLRWAVTWRVEP